MVKLCPKCARPLNADDYCEHCQLSVTVYEKIKNTSKILYNQGLQKAKVRDLTGAIDLLHRSVKMDKNNTDARNLLGLIYFEIGETVSALQQWVVSENLKPKDNEAVYFLNQVKKNQGYLDKLNQAIKKYNQSLTYIEQGSTDLAIIQLKKVTSLNPKYVKAYGLLALCYMKENNLDKAQKVLLKILAIDKSSYIARKYLDMIHADEVTSDNFEEMEIKRETGSPIGLSPVRTRLNSAIFQFVAMAIGVVIGLAIMGLMIMPARIDERNRELDTVAADLSESQTELEAVRAEVASLESALAASESQGNTLQSDNESMEKALRETTKVLNAMNRYVAGELSEAADALFNVDQEALSGEISAIYGELTGEVYPTVARKAYDDGYRAYTRQNFDEGIALFEQSYKLVKDGDYSDNALYFLARCYWKKDDQDTAVPIFERLLEEYPDADNKGDAEYFINQYYD